MSGFGEVDRHLLGEGRHERLWQLLGAHPQREGGVRFAVWAPNASRVSAVGSWNGWDGRADPLEPQGRTGVWEATALGASAGDLYKFELLAADGALILKTDPMATYCEEPPGTASRVFASRHEWLDDNWMRSRARTDPLRAAMSIYEVHLGSWRAEAGTYRVAGEALAAYCTEMGFTHVELLPIAEHPFYGSWGYQVSNFYAPTARYGDPDGCRLLVDRLHQAGIGVILDWVTAHFPRDAHALERFDGTALYEHLDPRSGAHPDWGTLIFNYGRNEVRNFLIANALYWLDEFHFDGLRVDAVASMLYLDYSREPGEWIPNEFGGRENLGAVEFLRELNSVVHQQHPGVAVIAEESTAWPGVSKPVYTGGLGFTFKWNMGWMHDTLVYVGQDPIYRKYHHNNLTFGLLYAWSENFILSLSHDEVVHGKGSLLGKIPGDDWQRFATLRALYAHMWAHPGKKLLFMGGELGQRSEWAHESTIDWGALDAPDGLAGGVRALVADLNRLYRSEPALFDADHDPTGFEWIDPHDADGNVVSYLRFSADRSRHVACLVNMSPVVRHGYVVGLPQAGLYSEVVNTDALEYGGSGVGNQGSVSAVDESWGVFPASASVVLPPLGAVWLRPDGQV